MRTSDQILPKLLSESLMAWRLRGEVAHAPDGATIASGEHVIRVARAPPELPFRWIVDTGDRRRGAVSFAAVLRQVRSALDPGYAASRVRVAPAPLLPP